MRVIYVSLPADRLIDIYLSSWYALFIAEILVSLFNNEYPEYIDVLPEIGLIIREMCMGCAAYCYKCFKMIVLLKLQRIFHLICGFIFSKKMLSLQR